MSRGGLPVLESTACSVACGGRCCEDFPINYTPEQIGELYANACARIAAGDATRKDWDAVTIAEMVVRIDEDDEAKPRYTCSNLDRTAGLCTIYANRPAMCSEFPDYGRGWACHICGFRKPESPGRLVETNPPTCGGGWRHIVDWIGTRVRRRIS